MYTLKGIRHFERHKNNLNPSIRGGDWARGRYHFRGEISGIAVSKEQDMSRHFVIEIKTEMKNPEPLNPEPLYPEPSLYDFSESLE